jgi:hypothetical protein
VGVIEVRHAGTPMIARSTACGPAAETGTIQLEALGQSGSSGSDDEGTEHLLLCRRDPVAAPHERGPAGVPQV